MHPFDDGILSVTQRDKLKRKKTSYSSDKIRLEPFVFCSQKGCFRKIAGHACNSNENICLPYPRSVIMVIPKQPHSWEFIIIVLKLPGITSVSLIM